jgi:hypothetical protein
LVSGPGTRAGLPHLLEHGELVGHRDHLDRTLALPLTEGTSR